MSSGRNKKKESRKSWRESGERDAGKDREKEKERGSNLRGYENRHLLLILYCTDHSCMIHFKLVLEEFQDEERIKIRKKS